MIIIPLTNESGGTVRVNVNRVEIMEPADNSSTLLHFTSGKTLVVQESMEEIKSSVISILSGE